MTFLGSFAHEILHFHFVLAPASYLDCHAKGLYLLEIEEITQHVETAEILIIQPFTEVNGKEYVSRLSPFGLELRSVCVCVCVCVCVGHSILMGV